MSSKEASQASPACPTELEASLVERVERVERIVARLIDHAAEELAREKAEARSQQGTSIERVERVERIVARLIDHAAERLAREKAEAQFTATAARLAIYGHGNEIGVYDPVAPIEGVAAAGILNSVVGNNNKIGSFKPKIV